MLDSAPHDVALEQALLGALLLDNRVYDRTSDIVRVEHFSHPTHQAIWEHSARLIETGKVASPITLRAFFVDDVEPGLTGAQYLGTLAAGATSILSAKDYAEGVRDLAVKRALMEIGGRLYARGNDPLADATASIKDAENDLYGLANHSTYGKGSLTIGAVVEQCVERADAAYQARLEGRPLVVGVPTGFRDLDAHVTMAPGNLIILAGRPGMGKSALALNIARRVAGLGVAVQYDSLEMSAEELGYRLLSEAADLTTHQIKTGTGGPKSMERLAYARSALRRLPLSIDDAGGLKIGQLAARARRAKRQRGIGLLIVDYLQLMAGGSNNRVADVTDITTGLKALAKDLEIPVIALSQLSRAVEQREDKRPQLSDLRESGSIEQDADVVMFVFREEYYWERANPRPDPDDVDYSHWLDEHAKLAGRAEAIVAKNRHGATNTCHLHFDGRFTRFADLAREQGREVAA
jgi:replicative DNA helicase